MWNGAGGGSIGSTYPQAPQLDKPRSANERGSRGCEEHAVPKRPCASSGSTHALKERRNRGWGVDLNDAIQVAYIDSKLKGAGSDDHAVRSFSESLLGTPSLLCA
jgi:hypothetical protein